MAHVESAVLCAVISLAGCGSSSDELEEPRSRVDLRDALEVADANAVGVTVDASGRRFVLDQDAGLFELTADGTIPVMRMADMPDPGVTVELPYTDVAALGNDQFALTAIGQGFLLDVPLHRQSLYFCYEPGDFPEDERQATSAVTFDAESNRIFAQPQTFASGIEQPVSSQIGAFDRASGADLQWYAMPDADFRAGGMAVAPDGTLVLGSGPTLLRFDTTTAGLGRTQPLDRYGVTRLEGLAIDASAGTLLAIDADADQLLEIPLADLAL